MTYQTARSVRRESNTKVGRFKAGKLAPVMAVPVRPSEGGMLSQNITMELDPIGGRMITPITGEFISVFVPVQAIDALKDPLAAYPGMTEVLREKMLSGSPLFGLEDENEISKRCGVEPRSIGGAKKVNEMVRIAHNCAVNHLRVRKYVYAAQLLHSNMSVTPALIGETVLDRLNGVLDPDDRINGAVELDIPNMSLPVGGIGVVDNPIGSAGTANLRQTTGIVTAASGWKNTDVPNPAAGNATVFVERDPATTRPKIYAQLNGASAGAVSLTDFYNAEKMDKLTREMRQIVDDNPEYGEEMVLRWAHGLSVDMGKTPIVLAERREYFGRTIVGATDSAGIAAETMRSDMVLQLGFSVPVPRTELGGIVVTFAVLKPDETLAHQPHPILSDVWGAENFVADELALDPVPVTLRELDSAVDPLYEGVVGFYTGLNQLKSTYVHYGLNRQLDPLTVEHKTAVWQLEIPLSVNPGNVIYPSNLSQYPFADQTAEVCTYTVSSQFRAPSPMIVGPTPVETLAVIGAEDLFEQV